MLAPSSASIDREAVKRHGFPVFVELAARHMLGTSYVPGRHIKLVAEHCDALFEGELLVFLLSIAPGTSKSFICSVLFPAYAWARRPEYRMICASYEQSLANFLASESKNLCTSDWYRDRWGDHVLPSDFASIRKRPAGTSEFWTADGGFRFSVGVKQGRGVGRHGHLYLIDDPIKSQALADEGGKVLDQTKKWFKSTAITRGKIGEEQRILAVAQRLHVNDLNGHIEEIFKDDPKFAHLCLPWHFEPERACVTRVGRDWRTIKGEVLWPAEKKTARAANIAMKDGPTGPEYRAQYQQDPNSAVSDYFPDDGFRKFTARKRAGDYRVYGKETDRDEGGEPFNQCTTVISVDPSFTAKGSRADFMAIDVWGYGGRRFQCFYSEWVKRNPDEALDAIKRIRRDWPATNVLIEQSANGFYLGNALEAEIPGLHLLPVSKSKEMRARTASLPFRRGFVYFDHAAPWYAEKALWMKKFPNGSHDDMVDTATQAINWLTETYGLSAVFDEAMSAITEGRDDGREPEAPAGSLKAQMAGFYDRVKVAETKAELGMYPDLVLPFEDMSLSIAEFE